MAIKRVKHGHKMHLNVIILLFLGPGNFASMYYSFVAPFQSLGYWSKNEYLEYKDSIPELKEFTVCHWEKTQIFSERFNTIWAYCQRPSKINHTITCIETVYFPPDENGDIAFMLARTNWGPDKRTIKNNFRKLSSFIFRILGAF